MRRLRRIDRVLLLLFVPLWLVCFALSVRAVWLDAGVTSILVVAPEAPDDYPRVAAFRPYTDAEATGLRRGDRVLRAGEAELRGVGPIRFVAITSEQAQPGERFLPITYERDGATHETRLPLVSHRMFWSMLPTSLTFALTAILGLLFARPTPAVRAAAPAFACAALETSAIFLSGYWEVMIGQWLRILFISLVGPLLVRTALRFPNETLPKGRLARFGPWLLLVRGVPATGPIFGWPIPLTVGLVSLMLVNLVALGGVLAILTRNYLRADAVGRRQLKWILLGTYIASIPGAFALPLAAYDPRYIPWAFDASATYAIVPFFIWIAVARYNLFDVERLLSATASYNLLLFVAVGGAFLLAPRLAEVAARFIEIAPATGQILSSLVLAALVLPAQRKLRPAIERVFFKERHAIDSGFGELLDQISRSRDAEDLTRQAGEGLVRLFRPQTLAIYTPLVTALAPVFTHGPAVPTRLEGQGPLMETLRSRRQPLALGDSRRGGVEDALGPFDRAVLETLGAVVVLPVRGANGLAAVVCLGEKQSRDIYTSTDLNLLSALADRIGLELARFDQARVVEQARRMQDALRRYVPGAIADQLEAGETLERGEREVSVLFVDIRGYTALAEGRRADEIFSTVNRYTEAVSEIVRRHGGNVVEFNGDGMMAVFGAPRDLAHKERSAVEAGRDLVATVGSMAVDERSESEARLSVGVGIATGSAFVGSIQAVDRMIWTAIGNPTNLAARLQSLTRELDAAIVIDRATWQGAGAAAAPFVLQQNTPIRGRREALDIFVFR